MVCEFEDSFLYSHRFLSLSLHFLTSFEIPVHFFGVYLIYSKTPKTMQSAKYIILHLHIVSSFMDFYISFLLVLYIFIPSPSGFPVGLLSSLGVDATLQVYILNNIMFVVALSTVALFENRYDVLVIGYSGRSNYRNLKRVIYFAFNFLCYALAVGYIFWTRPDYELSKISLHQSQPCIPLSLINDPKFLNLNVKKLVVPIITCSIMFTITIQGAYFFFYTAFYLFFSVRNVSKTTQQLQKRFFMAMFLQAFIPMLAFFAPLSYYLIAWLSHYYNQMYNNFAMITIGFNGLLTTIVMILVHAPYRQAVSGFVKRGNKVVQSSRIFWHQQSRW